jgi:hypothetical protein
MIRLEFEADVRKVTSGLREGMESLATGVPREAVAKLSRVVAGDPMSLPAWEGLAAAHEVLGHQTEAINCNAHAKQVREKMWEGMTVEDIRRHHPLWKQVKTWPKKLGSGLRKGNSA